MPSSLLLLILTTAFTISHFAHAATKSFTDSRGKVIERDSSSSNKPKIVINAVGAISLFHLGLPSSQLVGVYDHWVVRGSDLDIDNPTNDYESNFILDPNTQEIEFLRSAKDLSPSCSDNSNGCALQVTAADLQGLDYDYFVVVRAALDEMATLDADIAAAGKTLIWVDDQYEHGSGCYSSTFQVTNPANCRAASLIDTVRRLEALATFLDVDINAAQVQSDRQEMCQAAGSFVSHMQSLHQAGLFAAAASVRPQNGGVLSIFSPTSFPWLRTLEELGMPIIHVDTGAIEVAQRFQGLEWLPNCANSTTSTTATVADCVDKTTKYPVDFWLLDGRSYTPVVDGFEEIVVQFPEPAFVKRQFSYFLYNDGAISYKNIRNFLTIIQTHSTGLARVHTAAAQACVAVDVTSANHTSLANPALAGGQVACFDRSKLQSLYLECPNAPVLGDDDNDGSNKSSSTGRAISSIMNGWIVVAMAVTSLLVS